MKKDKESNGTQYSSKSDSKEDFDFKKKGVLENEQKKKREGNKFDKIWKENMFKSFLPILDKRFNLTLRKYKELTPKFQVTIEREVDFLRLVEDTEGNKFILNIEVQTKHEEDLILRIKEYEALISRRYKLPVRTYVFYLGLDFKRIITELPTEMVFSDFHLLSFCEIPYETFMESDHPEEIIVAILADLKDHQPEAIIKRIIRKLEQTTQTKASLNKFVIQLQVLSQLRNLDKKVNQITSNMSIFPDIRKNAAVAPIIQAIEEEKQVIQEENRAIQEEMSAIEKEKSAIQEEMSAIEKEKSAIQEEKRGIEKEMIEFKRKTIQTLLEIGVFSNEEIADKTETSIETVLNVKAAMGL